jgi:hypothetical protein
MRSGVNGLPSRVSFSGVGITHFLIATRATIAGVAIVLGVYGEAVTLMVIVAVSHTVGASLSQIL